VRDLAPRGYTLAATALSGGDPGWRLRTVAGGLPIILDSCDAGKGAPHFRLEARPGRYRIRFELPGSESWRGPRTARETEVEVPPGGEAAVVLPVP
jgi:hypothetical protein